MQGVHIIGSAIDLFGANERRTNADRIHIWIDAGHLLNLYDGCGRKSQFYKEPNRCSGTSEGISPAIIIQGVLNLQITIQVIDKGPDIVSIAFKITHL